MPRHITRVYKISPDRMSSARRNRESDSRAIRELLFALMRSVNRAHMQLIPNLSRTGRKRKREKERERERERERGKNSRSKDPDP